MPAIKVRIGAREATWFVLAAGYLLMLRWGLPGRFSVDSIIELHEGRFHLRENWGPAIFPWVLGLFDRLWPGANLYVCVVGLAPFVVWALTPALRRQASWLLPPLAAVAVASPIVLIYQANVWHDVFFANLAIAAFLCLAFAARDWQPARPPWLRLIAAAWLLAAAGLARQNGILFLPAAALAVGWAARAHGVRLALSFGLGWLAGAIGATALLSIIALPQGPGLDRAHAQGLRILAAYDLVGAAARDPGVQLPAIARESPQAADALRAEAVTAYSPRRVDFLVEAPVWGKLAPVSTGAILRDWGQLMLTRPDLYARVRAQVFWWVFATPEIEACLPVYLGIDGPALQMRQLGLEPTWQGRDSQLLDYATAFFHTPLMSHLAYAALALGLIVALLARRDAEDVVMAAMLLGALAFTASFLVLSLACDYRYLYALDLAVITAALYLASDPRLGRRAA